MKKLFLFCFVLSLIYPPAVMCHENLEECTIGVASGKATADGRPLMWKNLDASYRPREVVYLKDGRFKYLAMAPADASWISAGVNEFGFCIAHALAFDLWGKSKTGMSGNAMMKWALQQCVTVDDFESLLKQTNVSARTTACNIGVIDAFGGAAIFETGNFSYTRFDATDPKVAPQGYLIRANFALTGGGDSGRARYDRANQLWQEAIEKDKLDYRYVLRKVCRDIEGAEKVSYTPPVMAAMEDNTLQVLNNENAVSRPGTRSVALFRGVGPDENPSLTTFWAIIGGPIFSVAVPSWVIAESTAPEMDGAEFSPLCTAARDLYLANYLMGNKRTFLLNPDMLPDIWALTYPAEDRIFDQTENTLTQWRQDYPTAQQVASFHQHMASDAMDALQEVIELLVQKGTSNANLRIALYMRDLEKAEAFIEQGININMLDGHGYAPLHYAVQSNQKQIVELLISKNADVNAKNRSGQTPLNVAVNRGHQDIVELLLIKGADFNSADNAGNTSLHRAAQNGQRDIVGLLIDKGADLNAKNEKGQTAVDVAASRNRSEVVKLLIEKGADVSSIHLAAYLGYAAKVMNFIEQGSDLNTKDKQGLTPLHYSAMAGSIEVSELLLARGADVQAKTSDGSTAIHQAIKIGAWELAELLISKGADVNSKNNNGSTPLIIASFSGHQDAVEWLIAKGAEVNLSGREDLTALHRAARAGHRDVVGILLSKSADVNAKDKQGRTPLWWAERRGHTDVVELLRRHGANE